VRLAIAVPSRLRGLGIERVLAVTVLAVLGWIGALAMGEAWPVARTLLWSRATGWLAVAALLLSLTATPLGRALGWLRARPLGVAKVRRGLGITAACCGALHGAVAFWGWLHGEAALLLTWPHLRAGLVALGILVVLLATSFPRLNARLRFRYWKELHRLAYVAALLVLQHLLLSPFASRTWTLALFGAAFIFGWLRLLPLGKDP
jgi:sulfoxide reductase heme-binding subunit YedZ